MPILITLKVWRIFLFKLAHIFKTNFFLARILLIFYGRQTFPVFKEKRLYIEWNLLEKSVKRPFCCTVSILQHCKLTRRRRSNSIDFTVRLCDPVAPLVLILRTSVRQANLFGYITRIKNIFVLFNSSAISVIMKNNIWDFILTRIIL